MTEQKDSKAEEEDLPEALEDTTPDLSAEDLPQDRPPARLELRLEPEELDFGRVAPGEQNRLDLTVTNVGTVDAGGLAGVLVGSTTFSPSTGTRNQVALPQNSLAPEESFVLTFVYEPTSTNLDTATFLLAFEVQEEGYYLEVALIGNQLSEEAQCFCDRYCQVESSCLPECSCGTERCPCDCPCRESYCQQECTEWIQPYLDQSSACSQGLESWLSCLETSTCEGVVEHFATPAPEMGASSPCGVEALGIGCDAWTLLTDYPLPTPEDGVCLEQLQQAFDDEPTDTAWAAHVETMIETKLISPTDPWNQTLGFDVECKTSWCYLWLEGDWEDIERAVYEEIELTPEYRLSGELLLIILGGGEAEAWLVRANTGRTEPFCPEL